MTDNTSRTLDIPLGFLQKDTPYGVESWSDTPSGQPATGLLKEASKGIGGADRKISLRMVRAGGAVLILTPEKE